MALPWFLLQNYTWLKASKNKIGSDTYEQIVWKKTFLIFLIKNVSYKMQAKNAKS